MSGVCHPTGIPLLFISVGSTSLVVFMSAVGVVLNINKQSKTHKLCF
ncbi:MAG: FtsW/RodA/SpoVE family cell cycle protein [Clostridia bacterium]|nr:FtsW/RodA/SpoVE family cell cycle protein [Clostridia bacterium]